MLKVDLHIHTNEDPKDGFITYSARELIDRASELGFDVLAITLHTAVLWNEDLVDYAKLRGILLIPGAELQIRGKDVLVINVTPETASKVHDFSDLAALGEDALVIAPHPYFIKRQCLGGLLEKHINLFDAIEISHFYMSCLDRNSKAVRIAEKYNKPLVATSDCHHLERFGLNYTLVDAIKNVQSVVNAIKNGKVKAVHEPLSVGEFSRTLGAMAIGSMKKKFKR